MRTSELAAAYDQELRALIAAHQDAKRKFKPAIKTAVEPLDERIREIRNPSNKDCE